MVKSSRRTRHMLPRTAIVFVTFGLAYMLYSNPAPDPSIAHQKFAFQRHLLQESENEYDDIPTVQDNESTKAPDVNSSSSAGEDPLFPPDAFSVDQRKKGAVIFHIIGIVYMFYALALVCDEFFVPSLDVITEKLGISADVAGATFMAAGGSAPELFTSVIGVFIAKNDVGIGTIVGSAVFNILFVIAACAFAAKEALSLTAWPLIRDVFFYSVSLILLVVFFMDNEIRWWEALLLFLWYFAYVGFMKFNEPAEDALRKLCKLPPIDRANLERGVTLRNAVYRKGLFHLMNETINPGIIKGKKKSQDPNDEVELAPLNPKPGIMIGHQQAAAGITGLKTTLQPPGSEAAITDPEQQAQENGKEMDEVNSAPTAVAAVAEEENKVTSNEDESKKEGQNNQEEDDDGDGPIDMTFPAKEGWKKIVLYLISFPIMAPLFITLPDTKDKSKRKFFVITFTGSIIWIALYSYLMVWWATVTGDTIGIPPPVMGLTFLAAGTSVPDLITSVLVAKQGKGDMAVSSSVGSNIFDVCVGLPVPWLLWTLVNWPLNVSVSSAGVGCSVGLLFLMLLLVFLSILAFKWKMTKTMGVIMGIFYFIFVIISLGFSYDWYQCPI